MRKTHSQHPPPQIITCLSSFPITCSLSATNVAVFLRFRLRTGHSFLIALSAFDITINVRPGHQTSFRPGGVGVAKRHNDPRIPINPLIRFY
jgi:hypothetical protein